MQKSCTIFAVMLVLTFTVAMLTGVDFGLNAGGSSWLVSHAAAQDVPAPDAPAQDVPGQDPDVPITQIETPPQSEPPTGSFSQALNVLGIILLTLVLPYFIGIWVANAIRLPDMGRRLGVIFAALVCSVTIVSLLWPPQFGIDLQGGVILVYEVDEQASLDLLASDASADEEQVGMAATPEQRLTQGTAELITQLQKRINPSGVSEVVIRPYGENQVEIQVPQAESADIDSIKKLITKAGILEFMIVANKQDHDYLMTRAEDESQIGATYVTDRNGRRIGRWVRVDEDAIGAVGGYNYSNPGLEPYVNEQRHMVRGGGNGLPLEVLMRVEDPNFRLSGKHLSQASVTRDERNQPAVSFGFNAEGARRMGRLSQDNISEASISRQLGIVMDNTLISAPQIRATITDSGIITGNFTQDEVTVLTQVLRSGRLPVVLRKEPISEQTISATLGDDTIRKGRIAITISLIAVLIFMLIYYRVAGIIACFALLFNLVLILAVMIAISADLTLPGIAGLVLTVGMAVDANVLIFERIREELKGGASVRVALSNGFGKALSTIVDANVTTLITAAVLYRIGTDQVRGFAVTLFVGILMSMFTAIFVSRTIFDILERKKMLKEIKMLPSLSSVGFDFISKQKVAGLISLVVILVGLAAVGARGRDIFDIDFNGGSSIQVMLKEPMPISEVRSRLSAALPDLSVSAVTLEGFEDRIYKVDTSLQDYGQLGMVTITDRTGKSVDVDLSGVESLTEIAERLDETGVGVSASVSPDRDGIVFEDTTGAAEGAMTVKSADDTQTADRLRMNFSTDSLRYHTGEIPEGVEVVQAKISEVFTDANGESMLVMHNMDFAPPKPERDAGTTRPQNGATPPQNGTGAAPSTPPATSETPAATESPSPEQPAQEESSSNEPATQDAPATEEPATEEPATEEPATEEPATEDSPEPEDQSFLPPVGGRLLGLLPWNLPLDLLLQDEGEPEAPITEEAEEAEAEPAPMPEAEPMTDAEPMAQPGTIPMDSPMDAAGLVEQGAVDPSRFRTETELSFDETIAADTVRNLINEAAVSLNLPTPEVGLLDNEGLLLPVDSRVSQSTWRVKLSSPQEQAEQILDRMRSELESTPVWPSSSKIGSKVAGDMQTMAIAAVVFCLVGIVGYIWFRFQSVAFGIAAVAALVHDVLITLGAIAVSVYLAPALGFLQVTEFKISLPVVAAFLTIIGYSLNDTIVIFDRIREVRGKSTDLTSEMVNFSINQTLGRTLLTSVTTLIVVLILYFIGGEGIHSFAFSLVVGVIAGTYSTVFIACPVLIWLMNRDKGVKKSAA